MAAGQHVHQENQLAVPKNLLVFAMTATYGDTVQGATSKKKIKEKAQDRIRKERHAHGRLVSEEISCVHRYCVGVVIIGREPQVTLVYAHCR